MVAEKEWIGGFDHEETVRQAGYCSAGLVLQHFVV